MSGMYKTCKKCGRSLPATKKFFNENETSRDGYQSYCRSCQKKQNTGDKLKLMRKGGPKTKIRKPHPPKLPQFTPDKLFKRNK